MLLQANAQGPELQCLLKVKEDFSYKYWYFNMLY